MPSEQDHRKQEARNWAFYRAELGGHNSAYGEWAVTVIFYATVHKVEAFLRRNGARERSRTPVSLPAATATARPCLTMSTTSLGVRASTVRSPLRRPPPETARMSR